MKFTLNRNTFSELVSTVIPIVPSSSSIPALTHILIEAQNNKLSLTGTNLETTIKTCIQVEVKENGAIAVPGKILSQILKESNAETVDFALADNTAILKTNQGQYKLPHIVSDIFPDTSVKIDSKNQFSFKGDILHSILNKLLFAASKDDLRAVLQSICMQFNKNSNYEFVATDGHVLARVASKTDADLKNDNFEKLLLPVQCAKLLPKCNSLISINYSDDCCIFTIDETTIISKLIDGKYPNYRGVIPIDNDKTAIIDRAALHESLRRITIFSDKITHFVKLVFSENKLELCADNIEDGSEGKETFEIDYSGEPLEIGFNAVYLLSIINHIESNEIKICLKNSETGVIVYPEPLPNEFQQYVLMPIRIGDDS